MFKKDHVSVLVILLTLLCSSLVYASNAKPNKNTKPAIVIASFGTTVPRALIGITNIVDEVRKAYPEAEVRLSFTSNIIRKIWKKRQAEPQKWLDMGVSKEVLYVENILSVVGDLRGEGYRNIIVQPTHMFYMEQSHDLSQYVRALNSIHTMKAKWKPFDHVVMGRPALGMPGDVFSYHDDVAKAIVTLAGDVAKAEEKGASLVYMGHGNEHWSTGIYRDTEKAMATTYPQVKTFIGVVEGQPTVEDVIARLKHTGNKKVYLKPFMIVAGDHAKNDMAGAEADSWKSVLEAEGFEVETVLHGLGENSDFANIFVKHIADTAKMYNIKLN